MKFGSKKGGGNFVKAKVNLKYQISLLISKTILLIPITKFILIFLHETKKQDEQ